MDGNTLKYNIHNLDAKSNTSFVDDEGNLILNGATVSYEEYEPVVA
jgi:hypothetical protein